MKKGDATIYLKNEPNESDKDFLDKIVDWKEAEHAMHMAITRAGKDDLVMLLMVKWETWGHRGTVDKSWELSTAAKCLVENLPNISVIGAYCENILVVLIEKDTRMRVDASARASIAQINRLLKTTAEASVCISASCFPQDASTYDALLSSAQAMPCSIGGLCWCDGLKQSEGSAIDRKAEENIKWKKSLFKICFTYFKTHFEMFAALFMGILTVTLALSGICSAYLDSLKNMMQDESIEYLSEISHQISQNIQDMMESNFVILKLFGTDIITSQDSSLVQVQREINQKRKQFEETRFDDIALLDSEGNWYICGNNVWDNSVSKSVAKDVSTGKSVTCTIQAEGGEEQMLYACPIRSAEVEGIKIVGIAGTMDLDIIHNKMLLNAFNKEGYAYIVSKDGTIEVRSQHKSVDADGENVLELFKNASLENQVTVQKITNDFQTEKYGQIRYKYKGIHKIMTYVPMGINDWYLLTVMPVDAATAKSDAFLNLTMYACILISIFFLILLIIIFVIYCKSKVNLETLAYNDEITGGDNKRKFEMLVSQQIVQRVGNYSMLYANVEKFKLVNDQFGRKNADIMLKHIYASIQSELNAYEHIVRVMADHYAILVETQSIPEIVQRLAVWNNIINSDDGPLESDTYHITMTYGIYSIEDEKMEIALLIDRANLARKTLTAALPGAVNFGVYDETLKQKMQRERELENRMEFALGRGEFTMYLQPKFELATERFSGVEALVRWKIPEQGMVFPDVFISLFEQNGFIVKLDLYIFQEACRFIRRMIDEGKGHVSVSVNMSRIHLDDPEFLLEYERIWKSYQIPASLIELEFTETMIYDCMDQLKSVISEIHRIGFKCSMDDFGSGYSSLNMLRNIDVDVIKLDKNFFGGQTAGENRGLIIVKNIINLAKELEMKVVAEGVEEKWQVDFLREFGCDIIQGYYFAKPMPEEDAEKMLFCPLELKS